jgi:hypothetical protein
MVMVLRRAAHSLAAYGLRSLDGDDAIILYLRDNITKRRSQESAGAYAMLFYKTAQNSVCRNVCLKRDDANTATFVISDIHG